MHNKVIMGLEISLKGEKTEGKIAQGPLFPRLHVNDTKKIGTRAPPRNKMALYDQQLSIPSQKPSNPTSSSLAPPHVNGCMLPNPASMSTSSHSVGSEKSMFSPYKNSMASNHPNGKQASNSNEGIPDKMSGNSIQISMMSHINDNVNVGECPLPNLQRQPFELCNLTQFKWPTSDKNDTEQLRLPTFVHSRMSSNSHQNKHSSVGPNCTLELQTTAANDAKSALVSTEVDVPEEKKRHDKNVTPTSRATYSISNPKITLEPLTEEKISGVSDQMVVTTNKNDRTSEVDEADISKARGDEDMSKPGNKVCRSEAADEKPKVSVVSNASLLLRSESCHESVVTDAIDNPTPNAGNGNHLEEKDGSNSSVKDCAAQIVISPEVVVKMIGQDDFQKARNTMIHQQTAFAKQVFELHRLIKVQKMMAGSENILHKEHLPFGKDLLPPFIPEAPSWHNRSRNGAPKAKPNSENLVEKPPLPPFNADIASIGTNSAHNNISKSANSNMPMWCLPPPGNQWLFPVMSPSEGLIYKPCYPNHPPPEGFLGTLYNEGGPTNTNTPSEEFLHTSTLGVTGTSHVGPMYFAPYGMPILNPFASASSAFKQMTSFNSFNAGYPSSCNVAEDKDGGVKLESTASCAKKVRTSYDALPLFPAAPTAIDFGQTIQSCSNEKSAQVIKVIPHNPRLASESAARIVKLIQDERKHYCN